MSIAFKDRVKDKSVTGGVGDLILMGDPPLGYMSFDSAFDLGDDIYYFAANNSESEWELGRGILRDATTIGRETILGSSNSGALVNFSNGLKTITNVITKESIELAVSAAVSDLAAGAPEALNTLNELAAALGDDADFAATVTTALAAKANAEDLDEVDNTSDANKPVSTAQDGAITDATATKLNKAFGDFDSDSVSGADLFVFVKDSNGTVNKISLTNLAAAIDAILNP